MSDSKLLTLKPRNGVTIEIVAVPNVDEPHSLFLWVNDSLIETTMDARPVTITRLTQMAEGINKLIREMVTDSEFTAEISGVQPTPVTRAAWPTEPPAHEWEKEWPMNDESLIAELIQLKSGFVSPNDIRRIADEALQFVYNMIPVKDIIAGSILRDSFHLGEMSGIIQTRRYLKELIEQATTVRPIPRE